MGVVALESLEHVISGTAWPAVKPLLHLRAEGLQGDLRRWRGGDVAQRRGGAALRPPIQDLLLRILLLLP